MHSCCQDTNTWAKNVLDAIAGEQLPAQGLTTTQCNTWAKTILDALPAGCQHRTNGATTLSLTYAIGSKPVIAKTSFTSIDCGYLDVGSLIFSTTNPGAIAAVIGVTCDELVLVIVSQPAPQSETLTTEQLDSLHALSAYVTRDSLGELGAKYNALLALLKTIWPEVP